MKKIAILTIIFVILSNCEIKPRETHAEPPTVKDKFYGNSDMVYNWYQYHEEERDDMRFGIWSLADNRNTSSQTGYTVAVVNLTKDALEVELLKLQITELHKRLNP